MGCCCEDDDDDALLKHLNPTMLNLSLSLTPSPSSTSVAGDCSGDLISPMNSTFAALACRDTLVVIFKKLPITDLARSSCVCRAWNAIASDREIVERAFTAPWKLKRVVGDPISGRSFWRESGLGKFAISHRIARGDSVASLAVKYSVQVTDIKRLNNMMSEHGIYSRERLLIPVSHPEILVGGTCYVEMDVHAKREVAVLYLDGSAPDQKSSLILNHRASLQAKKRVIHSLKKSMQVDDGTAEYYLAVTNGDPRAALSEFSEDMRWEREAGFR